MCTKQDKELKDRIKYVLNNEGVKLARIANTEGERTMMSRQINGEETKVPYITIYKILQAVPKLSADWLVMGEGAMYKSDHTATRVYTTHNELHNGSHNEGTVNVGANSTVTSKTVEELQARIAELESDKKNMQLLIDSITTKPRI